MKKQNFLSRPQQEGDGKLYISFYFNIVIALCFVLAGCQSLLRPVASSPPPSSTSPLPSDTTPPSGASTSLPAGAQEAFLTAQSLREQGKTPQAIAAFAEFLRHYPDEVHADAALLALGDLHTRQQEYEKAQTYYQSLLQRFPGSPHYAAAAFGLGVVLYHGQDYAESLTAFQDTLKASQQYRGPVHYYLGEIAIIQKRYAEAIPLLQVAVETTQEAAMRERAGRLIAETIMTHLSAPELERLAAQYPSTSPGDLLLLKMAQEHRRMGNLHGEFMALQRFTVGFPRHPEMPTASQRVKALEEVLAADRTKIGVLLPLSGRGKPAGERALHGLQLALDVLKRQEPGLQLSLVIRDEGTAAAESTAALQSLVDEARVIGVIGPLFSRTARATAPVADKLSVPLISPYARDSDFPSLGTYTLRNSLTDEHQSYALAAYAIQNLQRRRFAIVYPEDAYGRSLAEHFRKQVEQLRGEVVIALGYAPSTTALRGLFEKLRGVQFDVVFLPDYADSIVTVLPTLAPYLPPQVQLLGSDGWNAPEITSIDRRLIEGAIFADGFFVDSPKPIVQDFVRQYRQRFRETPDILAAQSYDTLLLCAEVLLKGAATRRQLRDGLLKVRDFLGVSGLTSFDPQGEAEKMLYMLTVRNGKVVPLEVLPGL